MWSEKRYKNKCRLYCRYKVKSKILYIEFGGVYIEL